MIELRRLGVEVNEFEDGFEIVLGLLLGCDVRIYGDYCMVMSMLLVGL